MNILNWREVWHAYQSHEEPAVKQTQQSASLLDSLRWAVHLRLTDSNSHFKSKCLFLLRSGLRPRTSLAWYAYLHQTYLRKVIRKDIALLDAIHRPFFDRNIGPDSRLSLMQNHFHLSCILFGKNVAQDLLAGKAFDIASLQGKNQEQYRLSLFRCSSFKREGGLTLGLFQGAHLLQCLSFSFDHQQQQVSIRVGGVQSCKQDARELIRVCTKSLHGIQPRLLLIEALRCIAQELNCVTIECIAKKNHIYQSWRYRFSKCIRAEYDALWQSAGAIPHSNGNYLLPLSVEEKPWSARPSNKRSEYRARDVLTTDMRKDIAQSLAAT
ncbi:VirK/YbjX family protein [Undibacterium sp. Di26W]|uniref:VirK/YbjX family protein n=1 Tax=Undibacterium sp. Di26W TaxID=3413035 RepID=UPI003BF30233